MNEITLNETPYRLIDIGDGEPLLIITSRGNSELLATQIAMEHRHHKLRALMLNVSTLASSIFSNNRRPRLKSLAKDIHALLDIYWLDHVYLFSDYLSREQLTKLRHYLGPRATLI